jgi:hypothetical protein
MYAITATGPRFQRTQVVQVISAIATTRLITVTIGSNIVGCVLVPTP